MSKGYSRKKLDLTGQRFGKLTVIAASENIKNRTAWLCRCDCGSTIIAKTTHLRAGRVKSCGCLSGEPRPVPMEDGKLNPGKRAKRNGNPSGLNSLHYIDGTCVEMLRKNPVRSNNSSGVTGVEWRKRDRRWRASICFKGQRQYLGMFERFDDAVAARKNAEADTHRAFLAELEQKDKAVSAL